jgi:hypothetical protein
MTGFFEAPPVLRDSGTSDHAPETMRPSRMNQRNRGSTPATAATVLPSPAVPRRAFLEVVTFALDSSTCPVQMCRPCLTPPTRRSLKTRASHRCRRSKSQKPRRLLGKRARSLPANVLPRSPQKRPRKSPRSPRPHTSQRRSLGSERPRRSGGLAQKQSRHVHVEPRQWSALQLSSDQPKAARLDRRSVGSIQACGVRKGGKVFERTVSHARFRRRRPPEPMRSTVPAWPSSVD